MLLPARSQSIVNAIMVKPLRYAVLMLFSTYSMITFAENTSPTSVGLAVEKRKTDINEKFYRRALYFYFQGDYGQALRQLANNNIRLGQLTAKSKLFSAGLQLSVGLQQQAKNTLLSFEADSTVLLEKKDNAVSENNFTRQNELLLLALLQLAEQNVQQGQLGQAKNILQNITCQQVALATWYLPANN